MRIKTSILVTPTTGGYAELQEQIDRLVNAEVEIYEKDGYHLAGIDTLRLGEKGMVELFLYFAQE